MPKRNLHSAYQAERDMNDSLMGDIDKLQDSLAKVTIQNAKMLASLEYIEENIGPWVDYERDDRIRVAKTIVKKCKAAIDDAKKGIEG